MACAQCFKKSSVDAMFNGLLALDAAGKFVFPVYNKTGDAVDFDGQSTFTIRRPGLYLLLGNFNGAISGDEAASVIINAYDGAATIAGARANYYCAANTDIAQLSFAKIIEVQPSNVCNCNQNNRATAQIGNCNCNTCNCNRALKTITIQNIGAAANFYDGSVQIVKLA